MAHDPHDAIRTQLCFSLCDCLVRVQCEDALAYEVGTVTVTRFIPVLSVRRRSTHGVSYLFFSRPVRY